MWGQLLLRYRKAALIALGALALALWYGVQQKHISHLEASLAECRARADALVESNRSLLASVKRQNRAVEAMERESALRKERYRIAERQASRQAEEREGRALLILNEKHAGNECEGMREVLQRWVR